MLVGTGPCCVRLTNVDLAHRMNEVGVRHVVVPEGGRVDNTAFHKGLLLCLPNEYMVDKNQQNEGGGIDEGAKRTFSTFERPAAEPSFDFPDEEDDPSLYVLDWRTGAPFPSFELWVP